MGIVRKTVLVTDAERGSALSVVRSVGAAGFRVIAVSTLPTAMSFRSKYVSAFTTCPDPITRPDAFVAAILSVIECHSVDLVIPVTENTVIPLAAARKKIPTFCSLAVAEPDALATALNKRKTIECADALGVPFPKTLFVTSADDLAKAVQNLSWPVVVKPQFSVAQGNDKELSEECKISYATGPADIKERIRTAAGRYGFLLQEYCGGRGVGVELLVWNGIVQAAFQHIRLAEVPVTGGASALRVSAPLDPMLLRHSTRVVEALGWTGLCMIEFRGEGEEARLMEMNGRIWGSLPLAVQSGMNFPARLAELALGMRDPLPGGQAPDTNYRIGHRAYNPDLLVVWFGSVIRGADAIVPRPTRADALRVLKLCRGAVSDLEDPGDPGPGNGKTRQLLRKFVQKTLANWKSMR